MTVTDITRAIKNALETCFPYSLEVEGEICNFRPHYSGHAYFTLKDSFSEISAVMWKTRVQELETALAN
ncbi:MAG TPA: exodeoxyribonuclease VII large subunit, partial [Candidatus Obscuribacterales bacterium]